ncbi:TetR/AcrR family transcriptional regulator [Actinomycetospora flava]|uniref:TetR/AcrR family transcriptional regulator n=1 Tax=Actinomycetospora flava TaxID=3129232 RepID=A0ABU8M8V1_9PSEU
MAERGASRERWAAQVAALDEPRRSRARKPPITVERIVATAFALIEAEGYDALTMRRVATALETGPASLYAHVRDKAELDDLLIGEVCARIVLPEPDAARWREQVLDVCGQLRDQYFRYPGISRAALATAPSSPDALRLTEGLLAILLAGGVPPQDAAWTIDAAFLYVGAYSLEASLRRRAAADADRRLLDREEVVARFRMLPADRFPHTVAHAPELAGGEGHERFDFTLGLLLGGLG